VNKTVQKPKSHIYNIAHNKLVYTFTIFGKNFNLVGLKFLRVALHCKSHPLKFLYCDNLPLIHTYRTVRRNSTFQPFLLTSGLNRTPVYAAALIKQCLIQKITVGSYWVEFTWY